MSVTAFCMNSNQGTMETLHPAIYVLHLVKVLLLIALVEIGLKDFMDVTSRWKIIRGSDVL